MIFNKLSLLAAPIALSLLAIAPITPAHAQLPGMENAGGEGAPFNIEADKSLEWHQESRTYIARGKAKVTRKDFSVTGDILTGFERDKKDGSGSEIWKFNADGNVVISNGKANAFGDKAAYDIDRQVAVMTGKNLRLISGDDVVTAEDNFEYWAQDNIAIARGNATATRAARAGENDASGKRVVKADELTTLFKENAEGQLDAERVEAKGNVVIVTATDVATGNNAVYDLAGNKAIINGNVKLSRGKSQLAGDRAEVDFKTGVSRLLSTGEGKRVRGLLVPGEKK